MAKYSAFVFSSAKYGTDGAGAQPVITGAYTYSLMVKWAGAWVNEAGRCVDVEGHRGRQYYVARGGDTVDDMQPGWFTFNLDNYDGRYDPYNTSSPLTGTILPGRAVEFRVRVEASGVTYPIFTGRVRDIVPVSGENLVKLEVVDALQWLSDQDATIPMATNIYVSDAINSVLNACNYPGTRAVSASACPITYFDPQDVNALDVIRQLTDAGIGTAFVDRRGVFYYYDLQDADREEHNIDQAILLKQIAVSQPWENVRNKITTIANRYGYGPLEEIWRIDEPIGMDASSTKQLNITFENCKITQPERGVDYTAWSTLEGFVSGVGFTQVNYFFTVYLTNITGTSATVNIVNSVTNFMYLKFLRLRGNKIINKKINFSVTDATSISSYGPRRFVIDSPWLQDRGFAEAYSALLLAHLKTPSKSPIITFENREDALDIELLDQINLTSAKLGIDAQYDVGGIDYRWLNPTGQGWQATMYLQNILYSTDTITPQPYYPQIPPVPNETPITTPPEENPGGIPTWAETLNCLTTYPVPEGQNGPYSWPAGEINNSAAAWFDVGFWFRSIYHPYRTYIDVDGVWEQFDGTSWVVDGTFDFDSVTAYNTLQQTVATGSISGGLVADGVRRYYFNNVHAYYVQSLKIELIDTSINYIVGAQLGTDTWAGNSFAGAEISGLTIGNYYAVSNTGGPFYGEPASEPTHEFRLSNDNSNYSGGLGLIDSIGAFALSTPSFCLISQQIDATYARTFFQATGTSIWFRGAEAQPETSDKYSNNSGSLGWVLNAATVASGERRVRIRSIKLYNVCAGQSSTAAV